MAVLVGMELTLGWWPRWASGTISSSMPDVFVITIESASLIGLTCPTLTRSFYLQALV